MVFFKNGYCHIYDAIENEIFRVKKRGKSFSFDPTVSEYVTCPTKDDMTEIWHKSLGHCHLQRTLKLKKKDMTKRLLSLVDYLPNYNACQFGKLHMKLFPKST